MNTYTEDRPVEQSSVGLFTDFACQHLRKIEILRQARDPFLPRLLSKQTKI